MALDAVARKWEVPSYSGGQQKLQERNQKWINDDYVKFIRLAEHLIEKNGEGVLGFITNHGYLDNPTFRGMRWHLLNTFDKLYVLDLHGNSKKKEITPEGLPDKNVFDIQQGVAILIGVKKKCDAKAKTPKPLAQVFHAELWGDRAGKYESLFAASLTGTMWQQLQPPAPQYALTRRDYEQLDSYEMGFGLNKFMPVHGNGVVTKRDALNIQSSEDGVREVLRDFINRTESEVRAKYKLPPDVRDWRYEWAKKDVVDNHQTSPIARIQYRPFDQKFIFYSGNARGLVGWPVKQVMGHYTAGDNIGLLTTKAVRDRDFAHAFVTKNITEAIFLSGTTGSNAMNFPLYLYPNEQDLDKKRRINFDHALYAKLQDLATDPERGAPNEVAVFDYIYGVLHRPNYRSTYAEFLKIDFPRIPWPASPAEFWATADLGGQLRRLHLLEPKAVGTAPYPFKGDGTGVVEQHRCAEGRIWINSTQYFDAVPSVSWDFYIGGYQPAQKWLKDRKGCTLSFDDIKHYQRILKVLAETDLLMQKLDSCTGLLS